MLRARVPGQLLFRSLAVLVQLDHDLEELGDEVGQALLLLGAQLVVRPPAVRGQHALEPVEYVLDGRMPPGLALQVPHEVVVADHPRPPVLAVHGQARLVGVQVRHEGRDLLELAIQVLQDGLAALEEVRDGGRTQRQGLAKFLDELSYDGFKGRARPHPLANDVRDEIEPIAEACEGPRAGGGPLAAGGALPPVHDQHRVEEGQDLERRVRTLEVLEVREHVRVGHVDALVDHVWLAFSPAGFVGWFSQLPFSGLLARVGDPLVLARDDLLEFFLQALAGVRVLLVVTREVRLPGLPRLDLGQVSCLELRFLVRQACDFLLQGGLLLPCERQSVIRRNFVQ